MKRLVILFTFFLTVLAVSGYAQGICNDNIDNDGDGLIDCLDTNGGEDCSAKPCGLEPGAEIPGNNLDDDGDLFIDCYDKELLVNDACDGFFLGKDPCGLPPTNPKPFAMKLKFRSPLNVTNHINRLLVGDVDDDGTPEIVTTYRNDNTPTVSTLNFLRSPAVVGSTTLDVARSTDILANGDRATFEDIAMADINKDGCAEIFVMTTSTDGSNYKIISYDCNGNRVWTNPISFSTYPGNMGLADFNSDGDVELYCRTQIYNAHTGAFLGENNIDNDNTGIHNGVNLGRGMNSSGPVAVDVHPTPGLELIAGCRIYSVAINKVAQTATITLERSRPEYGTRTGRTTASGTSVADFNQDGTLDVVAVGSLNGYNLTTTIFFWDLKNDVLKTYTDLSGTGDYLNGWKNGAGRINLADIDGDTLMNAVYVSGKYLYALKEGATALEVLWRENVTEETSGYTGCTMFDFNADGKSEIVYRDEDYIYIFTTQPDGTVVKSPPVRCASRTSNEYPIVADMDGDGSTEICVACATNETIVGKNHSLYDGAEVRVYESANDPWVPARRVWNQHGYFVANVNDDLTIPETQQLHHVVYAKNAQCRKGGSSRPLNSFLNQSPFLNSFGCPSFAAPNLAPIKYNATDTFLITRPVCPATKFTVSFRFENRGDIGVSGNVPISFYDGDPRAGGELINTMFFPVADLLPGSAVNVDNIEIDGPGPRFHLYIVINDDGTTNPFVSPNPNAEIKECPGPDNIIHAVVAPADGPLTAVNVRNNTVCNGTPGTFNGAVKAFVPIGTIQDSVNFDFFWYDLTQTPDFPNPASDTSHLHVDLGPGDYAVIAKHKTFGCNTVGAFASVAADDFSFTANFTSSPNHNCLAPFDGTVEAVLGGDAVGQPDADFIFTWYPPGEVLTGDTLSSAKSINGLASNESFDLLVTHVPSGCNQNILATVSDQVVPIVPGSVVTDIACFENNSGVVSAFVGTTVADTTGFKFYWYNGNFVKPSPDYQFANYKHRGPGRYTFVVENPVTKCKSTPVTVEVFQKIGPTLTQGPKANQTSCDVSNPNGTANFTVSGGTGPYTFTWYNGANTNSTPISGGITNGATVTDIIGLKPQIYSVKVVDTSTGCEATDTVRILNRFGPFALIPASKAQEHCQPLDGEASVTPTVPGTITYTWYEGQNMAGTPIPGETGPVLAGVPAGFYTVRAVNTSTTCQAPAVTIEVLDNTKTVTITVVPDPTSYPTECDSENGTISATISVAGGNALGMDVTWFKSVPPTPPINKGEVEKPTQKFFGSPVFDQVTNVGTGYYTIYVLNGDDGCESEKQYFLPTINTDSLNITGTPNTLCGLPGNGEIESLLVFKNKPSGVVTVRDDYNMELYKVDDTGAGADVLVETKTGASNASDLFTFQNLAAGSYYVYARRADPSRTDICETFSEPFDVLDNIVDPTLALDSAINTNCFDGVDHANGQVITVAGGPPVQSIHYFEGANVIDHSNPIQTGSLTTLDNLKGGYFTVVLTGTNRCEIQNSIFVPADTAFIVLDVSTTPLTNCTPNPLNGEITINSVVEEKASGTGPATGVAGYLVTWFNSTGVTTIADPMPPPHILENRDSGEYYVHLKNTTTFCESGLNFAYVEDQRINPTIELIDFLTPSACLKIEIPPAPGDDDYHPVTKQRFGNLDVTITNPGPGGAGALSTNWTSGGVPVPVANLSGDDVVDLTAAGVFTVRTTNTTTACFAEEIYDVPLETYPITFTSNAVGVTSCLLDNGQLSAIVTSAGSLQNNLFNEYMYLWYYGDTDTTRIAHKERVVDDATNATYTLVVRDRFNPACEVQAILVVPDERINPMITAGMLKPLSICDTTRATPDGMAYAEVNGNTIDYDWEWVAEPFVTVINRDPIAENLRTGVTYTVTATNKITGCDSTASVEIEFFLPPMASPVIEILSHVTKCDINDPYPQGADPNEPDGALQASVGGNVTDYIFDWYNPGDLNNIAYTGILYDTLAAGEYTVRATDKKTFCEAFATELIEFKPVYPEYVIETDPTLCGLTTGAVYLTVTNDVEIADITWDWTGDADGDGIAEQPGIPNYETGPVILEAQSGGYDVKVTTAQNCWNTGYALVKNEINPFNGISRNGDNLNSYFHINCIESFPFNVVKIYNRAGTLVFEGKGYDNLNVLFDGESNKGISPMGTNLPDGTYFYVIDKHDGSKPLAGYLEIVN